MCVIAIIGVGWDIYQELVAIYYAMPLPRCIQWIHG